MEKSELLALYIDQGMSVTSIASQLECSTNRINYWLAKHSIKKRSISEAIYLHNNPNGDPFTMRPVKSVKDAMLVGLGIGLYWGEGTKANKYSVRLGNTDPDLLNKFIEFLTYSCGVNKDNLKFGLQIFTDINLEEALTYWENKLKIKRSQFYKTTVTISGSIGSYRKKSLYGVVTVYYHNKKLRDIIVSMLPR